MNADAGHHQGRLKRKIMVMAILPLLAAQGMMVGLVYFMGVKGAEEANADLLRVWTQKSLGMAVGFAYTVEQVQSLDNWTRLQALVDGFMVSHPDVKLLNIYVPHSSSPTGYSIGASSNRSIVGQSANADDLSVITSGQATYFIESRTDEGRPVRIMEVIAPIRDGMGGPVASTSISSSLEAVDGEISSLERTFITNLVIGAASLMGVSVLIFVMVFNEVSGRITRPLVALRSAAEAISTGDFEVPIGASSDDEIGDLAESFSRMRASLKLAVRLRIPTQPEVPEK